MIAMKKIMFASVLLLGSTGALFGENITFSENFESQTFPPTGWEVKGTELPDDLEEKGYAHWSLNWNDESGCNVAGWGCAEVVSSFYEAQAGIEKEEWLITPAIEVIEGASLSFTYWCGATAFLDDRYRYRIQLAEVDPQHQLAGL